jgi:thymidylate synthase (FAD)
MQILDHGYLKLIEVWGSDERIIEAARMSTSGGFVSWEPYEDHPKGDQGLLSYLWNNKHATPFEMAGCIIEVQAPIFVFREWHRHRTQSYNEMSARYTPMPNLNYVPTVERLMAGGGYLTKQASGSKPLTHEAAEAFQRGLIGTYEALEMAYQGALEAGVPKELARLVIPVGRYSRMRASTNLRNWLAFLTLRDHPKAQWEIQQYAMYMNTLLSGIFPRTMYLFNSTR